MANGVPVEAMTRIVEVLEPLSSEDRLRAIRAAMVLLGETQQLEVAPAVDSDNQGASATNLPSRTQMWMRQNDVLPEELQQVFHLTADGFEMIAPRLPGKNRKEQTLSAYILTGLGQFLATGAPSFEDQLARKLCEVSGCYDNTNHATYLKNKGNEFTGAKDKGWTLTAPGLTRAARMIKELAKSP
ncbi:hypothetical protein [Taklimakanibacter albus]|uniref:Uncharacterized protein n=1 Tax=Taklimakanibacter albus TaxID=2800327 RepID=A0ACC5R489_9HYPH|nr:hypothetical protein [Aestuariivirga sp. YIM B02566]MBK1867306.1 hypothetical protein [Aestuariivirga sp. YIM B02566]